MSESEEKCFVYVISNGQSVKIGAGRDPKKRLRELQTGNPARLSIKCVFRMTTQAAFKVESAVHVDLAQKALIGEWFDITPQGAYEFVRSRAQAFGIQMTMHVTVPHLGPTKSELAKIQWVHLALGSGLTPDQIRAETVYVHEMTLALFTAALGEPQTGRSPTRDEAREENERALLANKGVGTACTWAQRQEATQRHLHALETWRKQTAFYQVCYRPGVVQNPGLLMEAEKLSQKLHETLHELYTLDSDETKKRHKLEVLAVATLQKLGMTAQDARAKLQEMWAA